MKTAAITMLRRTEFPAAWSSLATIEPQLGKDVHHFLLLNDENDAALSDQLAARPHTTVLTPGRNLGVAVGRNRLIEAALDWGAEILISLDDDLLVPNDYVLRLTSWIRARSAGGEKIGVVAPATLDFHAVAEQIMAEGEIRSAEDGGLSSFWDTEDLRIRLASAWPEEIPVDAVYHAGIRDWRYHYLESYRSRPARLRTLYLNSRGIRDTDRDINEIRLRSDARRAIVSGDGEPFAIDTAPGGACAFTAELVREIGGLDEAFSPFGYEDSDFSIRSLRAGFANYSLMTEILLHDLDSRQKTRSPAILLHTQGRARALIARKHLPAAERARALTETMALAPLQAVDLVGASAGHFPSRTGGIVGSVVAYMGGMIEGLVATPAEPSFSASGMNRDYRSIPHRRQVVSSVRHRSWAGTPATGLPRDIKFDIDMAYEWYPDTARFVLQHLSVDAPGQIRISLAAEIDGVGRRDIGGNPDPLATRLVGLRLKVEDWGFLYRLQSTVAWFRRERSAGYFSSMLRSPSTRHARAVERFLSLRTQPASLAINILPEDPVSVAELYQLTPGVNLDRRLGFAVMVNKTGRY